MRIETQRTLVECDREISRLEREASELEKHFDLIRQQERGGAADGYEMKQALFEVSMRKQALAVERNRLCVMRNDIVRAAAGAAEYDLAVRSWQADNDAADKRTLEAHLYEPTPYHKAMRQLRERNNA